MTEAAAAAGTIHRAIRLDMAGPGTMEFFHNAEGIAAHVLHDAHGDLVVGGGGGHEHRLAVQSAHAAAVAGEALDDEPRQSVFHTGQEKPSFFIRSSHRAG